MKEIRKSIDEVIILGQELPNGKDIRLNIFGEDGKQLLNNLQMGYDVTINRYSVTINIPEIVEAQYIRLYFTSIQPDVKIEQKYSPEDYKLTNISITSTTNEIVPIQYFLDYVVSSSSKLEQGYEDTVTKYSEENRDGIRSILISAQDELERACRLYFTERTLSETKDYYFDSFSMNLWQVVVNYAPINSLEKFEIVYGQTKVADIETKLFVFDRMLGIIEFLPVPGGDSAGMYALLMNNLSGMALSIFSNSNIERIPNMFRLSYKTGLIYDGCDKIEKEGIRQAVSRRALIKILPIIDHSLRQRSRSEGIDGVSSSRSYGTNDLIRGLKEEEAVYIHELRMKYGRNVEMVIV